YLDPSPGSILRLYAKVGQGSVSSFGLSLDPSPSYSNIDELSGRVSGYIQDPTDLALSQPLASYPSTQVDGSHTCAPAGVAIYSVDACPVKTAPSGGCDPSQAPKDANSTVTCTALVQPLSMACPAEAAPLDACPPTEELLEDPLSLLLLRRRS
ncbi:hypothetical protein AMTR_s00070p00020180, partial [Amborella trichopoda]